MSSTNQRLFIWPDGFASSGYMIIEMCVNQPTYCFQAAGIYGTHEVEVKSKQHHYL